MNNQKIDALPHVKDILVFKHKKFVHNDKFLCSKFQIEGICLHCQELEILEAIKTSISEVS